VVVAIGTLAASLIPGKILADAPVAGKWQFSAGRDRARRDVAGLTHSLVKAG